MVHGEGHNSTGPAPSWSSELYRRCRVQDNERQIRLDAMPKCVLSDQPQTGTTGSGPLCLQTDNPTFIFVSWRPDPEAIATDAFTVTWTGLKAYANPPWSLVGRVLSQA